MRLILVRHGNTFEPGSTPYCIGANEDLPLVEKGRLQAAQFGRALKDAGVVPTAWYRGPLVRHKQFSEIAIDVLSERAAGLSAVIDERLNEINYGSWAGLTDQQIKDKFGTQVFEDWSLHCVWPANSNWQPSLEQLRKQITSFLNDMAAGYEDTDTVVVVSSGGRLRYFLEVIPYEFSRRTGGGNIKISTGHACILDHTNDNWSLSYWNAEPEVLTSYSTIWIVGTKEGMNELLEQLISYAGRTDVTVPHKQEELKLKFLNNADPFILTPMEYGFCIKPPGDLLSPPAIWNRNIASLHNDVIIPIKDKIGGVITGTGALSDFKP